MGLAAARALARQGSAIALIGLNEDHAVEIAAALAEEFGIVSAGVSAADGLERAMEASVEALGGLDGLSVTAGPMGVVGDILALSDEDWASSFEVQLMTTVRALRAALPVMVGAGGGAIVTTSALSIRQQKDFLPHYAAMKAAVASVTKNVALTFGDRGVRANCIAPGAIATEALDDATSKAVALYPQLDAQAALNRYAREQWRLDSALGRVGLPEEVGDLIAFLLSPASGYVTGALINIDGGSNF